MAHEFNIKNGFITSGQSYVYNNLTVTGLTLSSVPSNDDTLTQILARDSSGNVKYRNASSLGGGGGTFTGGTVTGPTNFLSGLTANTISATTYYNLPIDVRVTGGTYSANQIVFTNNTGGTFSVTGITASGISANWYGSFTDTGNQPVNGANTATAWTANTTEIANGISIVSNSRITFTNSGIYEVGYSAQIEKTSPGGSPNVTIWAAINGSAVTRSSSTITLTNQSSYQLPFVSYIFEINAGDYVEFYFSSTDSSIQLTTLTGLTSPTRPVSPSLILVAKSIGNAVLNTSGDSFVTGFSLSNSTLTLTQNRVGQYSGFSVNLPFLPLTGGTVSGAISATTYYGDGSNLSGISRGGGGGAGGQLYYFNISKTQSPYYEFATTATTAAEQTISATTGGTQTAYIGGFMTPSGKPNITTFPAGILSFYLHAYDENTNHNFNIYCELYKRTTGGTETLLFTSDPSPVIGSTVQMIITDGFFSGATLNVSDRLVVKVYGENLTNQTKTIYLVSEGSQHYSFALTTIPTFFDTFVTGGTYSNGTITFTNNSGNTFNVTGLAIQGVTGITANRGISATTTNNVTTLGFSGGTISSPVNFTNGLSANTISATTYQGNVVTSVAAGNNISVNQSTGDVTVTATPSDVDTAIQFNNAGSFGGDSGTLAYIFSQITFVGGSTAYSVGPGVTNSSIVGGDANSLSDNITRSVIVGGRNAQIRGNSVSSAIIGGEYGDIPNYNNTVILGGSNITATSSDFVYVPSLNINTTPANDDTLTQVLVRDSGTGDVKYRNSSTFGVQGITAITASNGISATTTNNLTTLGFSGGNINRSVNFTNGLTANTISATTYSNLPVTGLTQGSNITITSNGVGGYTISSTGGGGTFTGGTVAGATIFTAGVTANTLTVTGNTNISGTTTSSGDITGFSLVSSQSVGDEGGEIRLAKAQTNTTLSGTSITIDIYQNRLRFFETGSPNRGAYIDLTAASSGVGTNLLAGGGGGTFTGGTVTGPTTFISGVTANTIVYSVVTLSSGATIAVNAVLGNEFKVTLGGNSTLGNPTGAVDGQYLRFAIRQDSTGGRNLTFDTKYRFGNEIGTPSVDLTANKTSYLGVRYNADDDEFDVISFVSGY